MFILLIWPASGSMGGEMSLDYEFHRLKNSLNKEENLLLTSCSQTCLAMERIMPCDAASPWETKQIKKKIHEWTALLFFPAVIGNKWAHFFLSNLTHTRSPFSPLRPTGPCYRGKTLLVETHQVSTTISDLLFSTYWASWISGFPWLSSNSWHTWRSRASLRNTEITEQQCLWRITAQ